MPPKKLSEKDVEQLLIQYRSERRRLMFQLENIRAAIADLKALRGDNTKEEATEAVPKRGPGRPRKAESAKVKRGRKPGRPKKRRVDGGYRLSPWDNVVLDTIRNKQMLLPKEDLMKALMAWAKKNEPSMAEKEVEDKLTRVLQKLSGKRGMLGTHRTGLRRGYHYGLKEWFFASSGKLRQQHLDKLVLTKS